MKVISGEIELVFVNFSICYVFMWHFNELLVFKLNCNNCNAARNNYLVSVCNRVCVDGKKRYDGNVVLKWHIVGAVSYFYSSSLHPLKSRNTADMRVRKKGRSTRQVHRQYCVFHVNLHMSLKLVPNTDVCVQLQQPNVWNNVQTECNEFVVVAKLPFQFLSEIYPYGNTFAYTYIKVYSLLNECTKMCVGVLNQECKENL